MKKFLLLLAVTINSISATDKSDYNLMQNKIDVIYYVIDLKISDMSKEISAKTEIVFKTINDLQELKLNMKGMKIHSCTMDNREIAFSHLDGIITIQFTSILQGNTNHSLIVEYSGTPTSGLFIGKNKYRNFSAFSDNWANYASYWFPSIDHPSDKASATFNITVPDKYEVICNGDQINKAAQNNSEVKYTFQINEPIPTYCMVVGVCDFAITETKTASGIPIYYYTYPEDSLHAVNGFKRVTDMVSFYEETIGHFPYSRLSLVESSTIFGGMENSSAIFFTEKSPSFTGERDNEETVAHEIAHQWFGDAVTMSDWSEIWLSEGFATYFTALYFEAREGEIRFNSIMNEYMKSYKQNSKSKIPVIYNGYKNLSEMLNVETYQKGAFFLHTLRRKIGDKNFFKSIQEYYKKFIHTNANTNEFKSVVEKVSGKDLDELFYKWLYQPGLPN